MAGACHKNLCGLLQARKDRISICDVQTLFVELASARLAKPS